MANTASGTANLADLFKTFGPAFFGSGTTTTSVKPDDAALSESRRISSQAYLNSLNSEQNTKDIVSRIITKNAIAFGPAGANARVAGLYNDTVLKQLATEAQAQSTAEASKAVLDYQTNQLGISQRATSDQLAASRTQTSQTAAQVPSSITSLLGLGLGGVSIYKNRNDILDFLGLGKKKATDVAKTGTDGGAGEVANEALESGSGVNSQTATDAAFGDSSVSTSGGSAQELGLTLPSGEENVNSLSSMSVAPLSSAQVEGLEPPVDPDAESIGDTAVSGSDALGGVSEAAGDVAGLEATAEFGTGVDVAQAGEGIAEVTEAGEFLSSAEAADSFSGFGGPYVSTAVGLAEIASGDEYGGMATISSGGLDGIINWAIDSGSIICAELKKQGRLSDSLARRSLYHFRSYKNVSRDAYYIWAKPSVRHLQTYPESFYSKALSSIFNARSKNLVSPTIITAGAYALVSAVTILVGLTILPIRNLIDSYKMHRYLKNLYKMRFTNA